MSYILISCALWIGGWILAILCNIILSTSIRRKAEKTTDEFESNMLLMLYKKQSAEIVKDGNSMFVTGLLYTVATVACVNFGNDIVRWIIAGLCAIFCIPPLLSTVFSMVPQAFQMKFIGTTLMAVSALVTSLAQAIMVATMVLAIL